MNKYAMEFSKSEYIKFISHLDLFRLFRNSFKIAGIRLAYSQGFNPHPKMSFAQPLSLGYLSDCEMIEFETKESMEPSKIRDKMTAVMPVGIGIKNCALLSAEKSLASRTYAAAYEIRMPVKESLFTDASEICEKFLNQNSIFALKIQKKSASETRIDIRGMIRELSAQRLCGEIILNAKLDSGSASNLSPELLISSFVSFAGICVSREEIEVKRTKLFFN